MAWEWVGAVATGTVGLAGIGATLWTQRRGRANTLAVAAEGRAQDRKRAAYERLLTQAIATTEFVGNADFIWHRHGKPPDVDSESYDAWLVLDLYSSPEFRASYRTWLAAVSRVRDVLDDLPDETPWYEAEKEVRDEFSSGKTQMDKALQAMIQVARSELS